MTTALHLHSAFSLRDGVPTPQQLAERGAVLGYSALALTDHNAVYGAIPFAQACQAHGIKPIIGAELTVAGLIPDRLAHLTLLAMNETGYANLCQLITLAHAQPSESVSNEAQPTETNLNAQHLTTHNAGLICLSGCLDHGPVAHWIRARQFEQAGQVASDLARVFSNRFYLELQRHYRRSDWRITRQLVLLAGELGLPYVAGQNAHYLDKADADVHDVLTCIRHRVSWDKAGTRLRTNDEWYLRSPEEMRSLYVDNPQALATADAIAERCTLDLMALLTRQRGCAPQLHPDPPTALRALCEQGAAERYGRLNEAVRKQLDHELGVIEKLGLCNYFLLAHDVCREARARRVLYNGRGSAANSLCAYALYITSVEPLASGLVFERFLNELRDSPADIDIDFAARDRESMIQYVYERHGREHAAILCTYSTFGARSALRDVGMVLGFPKATLDEIIKPLDQHTAKGIGESEALRQALGDKLDQPAWQRLFYLCERIDALPRHLSEHVGGFYLSDTPITDVAPIEPATMPGRTIIALDKDQLESVGLAKLDLLSLRVLSAIEDALDMIESVTSERPDLTALPCTDAKVYDHICKGRMLGVFQIGSPAEMAILSQMQPRNLRDLSIQCSLIRPGPIQGNMVKPYLRRRTRRERVTYLHPLMEPALRDSLGVIIWQEQILQVARDVAGFDPARGELLRRALGHKRSAEQLTTFHADFVAGAMAKGVPEAVAEKIYLSVQQMGGYSFARSHALSFALITYWHAWLHTKHPAAFFAATLANMPMGMYPVATLLAEAKRHGVKILRPDINASAARPTLAARDTILLGLASVEGLSEASAQAIVDVRGARPFANLADVIARTDLDRRASEQLILAGALDGLWGNTADADVADADPTSPHRRQLIWDLVAAYDQRDLGDCPSPTKPFG